MRRRAVNYGILLLLLWASATAVYIHGAVKQRRDLNLSAAAGGQYPYLTEATRMAREGVTRYLGDRNRMPLYPAMLSTVCGDDWDACVDRSSWFAIVSSLVLLAAIGGVAYALLPAVSATLLTLATAFLLYLPKASFVQAELLYYALFFAAWLLLCRLLHKPRLGLGLLAGVMSGLAYLTKASALLLPVSAVVVMVVLSAIVALRRRRRTRAVEGGADLNPLRGVACAVAVCAGFVIVAFPYLADNKARYERYFYNVNSTFFMWCDRWAEAREFSGEHDLAASFPAVSREQLPGPQRYWRTHTIKQIGRRLAWGSGTLARLAVEHPLGKYIVCVALYCAWLAQRRRGSLGALRWHHAGPVAFTSLACLGYLLVYAWYTPVAYGDRFVASLMIPALFAALWLAEAMRRKECRENGTPPRTAEEDDGSRREPAPRGWAQTMRQHVFLRVMLVALMGEAGVRVALADAVDPTFVRFYYSETQELLNAGNRSEAVRGLHGVLQLDPSFAPAHRTLGYVALKTGRLDDAIEHLRAAIRLDPQVPDAYNTLGSALLQAQRVTEAVETLTKAVTLEPDNAAAWYNLGVAFARGGAWDEFEAVRERLETLAPKLARRLAELAESRRTNEGKP